jgi:hypothetical protein
LTKRRHINSTAKRTPLARDPIVTTKYDYPLSTGKEASPKPSQQSEPIHARLSLSHGTDSIQQPFYPLIARLSSNPPELFSKSEKNLPSRGPRPRISAHLFMVSAV